MCAHRATRPPAKLDGAIVLEWCWSGENPFGHLSSSDATARYAVHGQAICQYPGVAHYYRFSCACDWEVEQDSVHDTVDEAKQAANQLYGIRTDMWCRYIAE